MLIKHQSFEVTQKKTTEKRYRGDKLYDAKKYPYLKYILIPGIIGFMLLCILVNVRFSSGDDKSKDHKNRNGEIFEETEEFIGIEQGTIEETAELNYYKKDERVKSRENPLSSSASMKFESTIESRIPSDPILKLLVTDSSLLSAMHTEKTLNLVATFKPQLDKETKILKEAVNKIPKAQIAKKWIYNLPGKLGKLNLNKTTANATAELPNVQLPAFQIKASNATMNEIKVKTPLSKGDQQRRTSNNSTSDITSYMNYSEAYNFSLIEAPNIVNVTLNIPKINVQQLINPFKKSLTNKLPDLTQNAPKIKRTWKKARNPEATILIENKTDPTYLHRREPRQVENELIDATSGKLTNAIKCQQFIDTCTLMCDTGGLSHIDEDLDDISNGNCSNKNLTVELKNCEFLNGIMKSNFLSGFYNIGELRIINCNLATIQKGVFKGNGAKCLQRLQFTNNSINALDALTFEGLKELKHFEFSQDIKGTKAIETAFLTPMAATLVSVKILQRLENNAIVDPSLWFQGINFINLYILDLSFNNLQGVLKPGTFHTLTEIGKLHLNSCSLQTIDIKVFEPILNTLSELNLDQNSFLTLDPFFMDRIQDSKVMLSVKDNNWQCDCEHMSMIEYLIFIEPTAQYINMNDFVCNGPEAVKGTLMTSVTLNCDDDTTTTDSTTTTATATKPTTKTISPPLTTTPLSTTSATKSFDGTTTTPSITSTHTTSPTHPTTTPNNEATETTTIHTNKLQNLTCHASNASFDTFELPIQIATAVLTIYPLTSSSVKIRSSQNASNFRIIHFITYSQYSTTLPATSSEWIISHLKENQVYMFCIIAMDHDTVSPFDCWPHFILIEKTWLLESDQGWFITVILIVILVFCMSGGAAVFFILRHRPCWLGNLNARVVRVTPPSQKIILLPKRSSQDCKEYSSSDQTNYQSQSRRVTYLSPKPEHATYSIITPSIYGSVQKPPSECAPRLPDIVGANLYSSPCCSSQRNNATDRLRNSNENNANNYGYNHYEEIKF